MAWNKGLAAGLLACLAGTSIASMAQAPAIDSGLAASIRGLASKDERVAAIAYRLQTSAADQCARKTRLSGLIVQDASQYRANLRPAMAALYNLRDLPAVTGVVPGGVGDRAGIRAGDEIVAVNGTSLVADMPIKPAGHPSGDRYAVIADRLDAAFQHGPVAMTIRQGDATRTLTLIGAPACISEIQLDLAGNHNAGADGKMVTVSQGIVDFSRNDDELAFVIGHELAHNILGHRDFLDETRTSRSGLFAGFGGNGERVRETERQADYFGLYLVAIAGYDYHAAAGFWRHMGRSDPINNLITDGTHPGTGTRIHELEREAAEIDTRRARHQPLIPDYQAFEGRAG